MRLLESYQALNRGLISRLGLARTDVKRVSLSAEIMTNWVPRVLGSMSIRPGSKYLGSTYADSFARFIPFVFSSTDTALIELTSGGMRVWVNDALVTRPTGVTTAVASGNPFVAGLAGWTVTGGVTYVAPYMQFLGGGTTYETADQQVVVAGANNVGVETALRIKIARGPVTLRVGTNAGDDNYIRETVLQEGTHSLAFTPGGNFYIRFMSRQIPVVWVEYCYVEAGGVMVLPTEWATANLGDIRYDQSGDVIFCACNNIQQGRIERRATHSWSAVRYMFNDGPFRLGNSSPTTITPSAIQGNITLTASAPIFQTDNVRSLYSLISKGQYVVSPAIAAANTFSTSIRVTGVTDSRTFFASWVQTAGAATTTVISLQQSLDGGVTWNAVRTWSVAVAFPAPGYIEFNDKLDNEIVYYRIGVAAGDYVAGTFNVQLSYAGGSITGVCRVTGYTSSTVVNAEVVSDLGGTSATSLWAEGEWSPRRGYPSAVAFHEGRLWWAGKSKLWGSVSDIFNSFNEDTVGDSGPVIRELSSGPVDKISWLASTQRLLIGTQGAEKSCRSSALDEPITPTAFVVKDASTLGSAGVMPARVDKNLVFVQRNGIKVYEMSFTGGSQYSPDYGSSDLTQLIPDIGYPGIVRLGIQRMPETRIHCVRSDGTVAILIFDKIEEVSAWVNYETDGVVEDVVVLPSSSGVVEDQVYYVVLRTINGSAKRYLEKWAYQSECEGAADSYVSDCSIVYTGSNAGHLEGKAVTVWQAGVDIGSYDGGDAWAEFPGDVGDLIESPDSAAFPSGAVDIEIIARLSMPSWDAPAAVMPIVTKYGLTGGFTFAWYFRTDGTMIFRSSLNGSLGFDAFGTASTGFAANSTHWVRVTTDVASGNVYFWTSEDGVGWVQLGATMTACYFGLYDSAQTIKIGAFSTTAAPNFVGQIYNVAIINGAGTALFDFSPTSLQYGRQSYTAPTGEVWSLLGNVSFGYAPDGTLVQRYTVASGVLLNSLTLGTVTGSAIVGLPYEAPFQSAKIGNPAGNISTVLNQTKNISHVGFVLDRTHPQGIRFGADFDHLDSLPRVEHAEDVDLNAIMSQYDEQEIPFPGTYNSDARLCLLAAAPRPCTVLAATIDYEMNS